MGWWPINSVEHGGIDWSNKNWNSASLYMGDGPADMLGGMLDNVKSHTHAQRIMKKAMKEIVREYVEEFSRSPHKEELIACFNFVQAPKIFMKDWKFIIDKALNKK